jgi:DNA modification methylase
MPRSDALDRVLEGDCRELLASRPAGFCDLAYLDPPFNTGRSQRSPGTAYTDAWPSPASYLAFLRPRVEAVHRALGPRGAILLHCDWRGCHHIRHMLDEVFGPEAFVNHLIWVYGLGGSSPRRFARKHDDILYYARGPDYWFEPPLVPATSARMKGQLKKATDVLEIAAINNMATERVGYPTQKPLALLSLLIRACCPPGGVVLDPFCGSGTTLVAARDEGRRFLGIDNNPVAVRTARERLGEVKTAAAGPAPRR